MVDAAWPLWAHIMTFILAAGAIGIAGTKVASLADRFADRTGLGEAVTGTIFLGFTTALPGLAASVTAALNGHPTIAVSNALGGIAFQTTFLAVADLAYRRVNLEHAAASVANLMQTAVLILLLTLVLMSLSSPNLTIGHVHPSMLVLFATAGGGFWLVSRTQTEPMWYPRRTPETVEDTPEPAAQQEHLGTLSGGSC